MNALLVAAALAVGYVTGRTKPLAAARWRTESWVRYGRNRDRHLGWRHLLAYAVLHPRKGAVLVGRAAGILPMPPPPKRPSLADLGLPDPDHQDRP